MDQHAIVDELARLAEENAQLRADVARLSERLPRVDRSSRRRDRRLTLAYVFVAIFAVSTAGIGTASALKGTNTVFSDDIVDETVKSVDIARNSLITSDIQDGTIAGRDVQDGSLNGSDLNLFNDNQCTGETVQGTAVVVTHPVVSDTFSTNGVGYGHSCSGEPVTVKRRELGVYEVDFGAGSPSRLAMVTANNAGFTATAFNLDAGRFEVRIFYYAGYYADSDFSILAY